MFRVAILTVSDRASTGEYVDQTGPALGEMLNEFDVVEQAIVPDDIDTIAAALTRWSDDHIADLIVTNGGTGLAARDVTPEATLRVIERNVPGFAEAMRAAGCAVTPKAILSRQVVGIRGKTLIVNVPGSPAAATESLAAVIDVLPHALGVLGGGVRGSHQ